MIDQGYVSQGSHKNQLMKPEELFKEAVHKGVKHECSQCLKAYVEKQYLRTHFRSTHEGIKELFSCNKCAKNYQTRDGLRAHIRGAHKGLKHTCSLCTDKTYAYSQDLRKHMQKAH